MQEQEKTVVVLFTDISGYTEYVSKRGNVSALELLHNHNDLLLPIIGQFEGVFVKGTGDGLIAYFDDPNQAIQATVEIQSKLAAFNQKKQEDEEIHIRLALHLGKAIIQKQEIIGNAVNVAARLVAICKRDQIIISHDLKKSLKRSKRQRFSQLGQAKMHGVEKTQQVYEVLWQEADLSEKPKTSLGMHEKQRANSLYHPVRLIGILLIAFTIVSLIYFLPSLLKSPEPLSTELPEAADLYTLAQSYQLQGDDEQAIQALKEAIRVDPDFAEAYLELAFLHYDMQEDEAARTYVITAETMSDGFRDNFTLKAKALREHLEGRSEKAVQLFQILVDRYPNDTDGLFYLADVAAGIGRLDQARTSIEKCVDIEPLNPFCQYELMMMRLRENRFSEVMQIYDSLRSNGVQYVWLDEPQGIALWATGAFEEAINVLGQLSSARIKGVKAHGTIHFQTGKAWMADIDIYRGELESGARQIELLLSQDATNNERILNLAYNAKLQRVLGNDDKALTQINMILSLGGPSVSSDVVKILTYSVPTKVSVNTSKDQKILNSLATKNQEYIAHLIRGLRAIYESRFDDANEELSLSYELSGDLEVLAVLTHLRMHQGDWQSSFSLTQEMIQQKGRILVDYPPNLWTLAHYDAAICLEKLGQPNQSAEYFRRFRELWSGPLPQLPPTIIGNDLDSIPK